MNGSSILTVSPRWREQHPGASVGVLAVRGVTNPPSHEQLNAVAGDLETELRATYGEKERAALRNSPPLPAYAAYYKRWGQRYHVGMQFESVAQKGKPVPRVAALVEAMFIAELRNRLLTAGHDLDQVALPVQLGSGEGESFTAPNGTGQTVKEGDMFIADADGHILSAIITGPSDFARIGPDTTAALFYTYAPPGVGPDAVSQHLDEIERNVRLFAPDATLTDREIVTASPGS
jgi:DNA/RNA-binding domain of Phe-tRNA-synthetase-like protein